MSAASSTQNASRRPPAAMPPRRFLALWLPFLATDRVQRRPGAWSAEEGPLVLVEKVGGGLRLTAVAPEAAALGLHVGLTLADARARVPNIAVREADPIGTARLLETIGAFCERYTPWTALDPPEGLILDISGCAHLFGGEEGLRTRVLADLSARGLRARATIASNADLACALVRHAEGGVAQPEDEDALARRLPTRALRIPAETVTALLRAGLKTVGMIAERPSGALTARFGAAFTHHLDCLFGRAETPRTPLRTPAPFRVDAVFAEPLGHAEAIEAALKDLIVSLSQALEDAAKGGRAFEASFFRTDGVVRRIAVECGRPLRRPDAIARLFRERMDALADPLDPGFGFDSLRLSAPVAEPLAARQTGLDSDGEASMDVDDLVDRLAARLGETQVLRFVARDTHAPERAARLAPATHGGKPSRWERPEPDDPPLRPATLFSAPQPVEALAEVPDGPPLRFRWRRVVHEVAASEGPERLAPEWWCDADGETRDYYRVEDRQGRRFWMFREGVYGGGESPRWFIHGLFA